MDKYELTGWWCSALVKQMNVFPHSSVALFLISSAPIDPPSDIQLLVWEVTDATCCCNPRRLITTIFDL